MRALVLMISLLSTHQGLAASDPTLRIGYSGCSMVWDMCRSGFPSTLRLFLPMAAWKLKPELWDPIIPRSERMNFSVEWYGIPGKFTEFCCKQIAWDWPRDIGGSGPYVLERIAQLKNGEPNYGNWSDISKPVHVFLASFMVGAGIHEREAILAGEHFIPLIGASSDVTQLSDKNKYEYYLRVNPTAAGKEKVLLGLMSRYGWKRVALLSTLKDDTLRSAMEGAGLELKVQSYMKGISGSCGHQPQCAMALMQAIKELEVFDYRVIVHENVYEILITEPALVIRSALVRPGVTYILYNPSDRGCAGVADFVSEYMMTPGLLKYAISKIAMDDPNSQVVEQWNADPPTNCKTCSKMTQACGPACDDCDDVSPTSIRSPLVARMGPWKQSEQCQAEMNELKIKMKGAMCLSLDLNYDRGGFMATWGAFAQSLTKEQWIEGGMPIGWVNDTEMWADDIMWKILDMNHFPKLEASIFAMVAFNNWLRAGHTDEDATSSNPLFFGSETVWPSQSPNMARKRANDWLRHVKGTTYSGSVTGTVRLDAETGDRIENYAIFVGNEDGIFKKSLIASLSNDTTSASRRLFSGVSFVEIAPIVFSDNSTQQPKDRHEPCMAGSVYNYALRVCEPCLDTQVFVSALDSCLCKPGYIENGTGCLPCQAGSISTKVGSLTCDECPRGLYAGVAFDACVICPAGKYQDETGQGECKHCGNAYPGTVSDKGALSPEACYCEQGSYYRTGGFGCTSCTDGLKCPQGRETPTQEVGFYVEVLDASTKHYNAFECAIADWCPGGSLGSCNSERQGRACARVQGKSCSYWFILIVPALMIAIYGVYRITNHAQYAKVSHWSMLAGNLGIALSLMQAITVYVALFEEIPKELSWLFDIAEIFMFKWQAVLPECNIGQSFAARLSMSMLPPLLIIGLSFLNSALTSLRPLRSIICPMVYARAWNCAGMLIQVMYIMQCKDAFSYFSSRENPCGKDTLFEFTDVVFFSDEHVAVGPLLITVYLWLFYVFGTYAVLAYVVFTARSQVHNNTFWIKWKFVFSRWRPSCRQWGCILLLRNFCIALTPIVVRTDHLYKVLVFVMVIGAHAILEACYAPWSNDMNNVFEVLISSILVAMGIVGLAFTSHATDSQKSTASIILVVLMSSIWVSLVASFGHAMLWGRSNVQRKRQASHHQAGMNLLEKSASILEATHADESIASNWSSFSKYMTPYDKRICQSAVVVLTNFENQDPLVKRFQSRRASLSSSDGGDSMQLSPSEKHMTKQVVCEDKAKDVIEATV